VIDGDLAPVRVADAITTRSLGRAYVFLPTCASTNDEAAARAAAGADQGLLVVSDEQSAGRGRRGRTWHSPAGENLYLSLLLRPAVPAHRIAPLTLVAGAALARALMALGFSPRLKWPNDVLLDGPEGLRKVAGILTEMATEGRRVRHAVLGIGINVNARAFPGELAERATSLRHLRGAAVDRVNVLATFLGAFEPLYDDFVASGPGAGLRAWQDFALFGQACWVQSGARRTEGIAESVDEHGALLIRTGDGKLVAIHAGEVNWQKTR